jgi:hypothetical protein
MGHEKLELEEALAYRREPVRVSGGFDEYREIRIELWDIIAGILTASEPGTTARYEERNGKYHVLTASPFVQPLCRELSSACTDFDGKCGRRESRPRAAIAGRGRSRERRE